jgi:hypothetical protein
MDKRIFDLYEYRGDLLETAAIAAINERPFYMGKELAEIDQQIHILESITPEAQAFYFGELRDAEYTGRMDALRQDMHDERNKLGITARGSFSG